MISDLVRKIKEDRDLGPDVVHHRTLPPRPSSVVPLPPSLPEPLARGLEATGIRSLYAHQAEALARIEEGRNVVVITPTASGKTLTYNLPVFRRALEVPGSRALYIFPTKALEQDQRRSVEALAEAAGVPVSVEVYDGDTTQYRRGKIRLAPPSILITNPDMVHLGLLGFHGNWEDFLHNLSFVVIDEIHTYKGIFGSHIAQVLRRLRRVAALHGASPRFIACSATIANPAEFARALTGLPFDVVERDGSPASGRHFVFVNPSGSPYTACARLFAMAVEAGLKTIVFTKARKITELIHSWIVRARPSWRDRISSYRAGFLPTERREIEAKLASGELDGVVSTSALEVGIDIGGLDVCILAGYPGTLVNARQRGGRVGRGRSDSLVVLVAQKDALDQYFMRNPDEFFGRSFEAAVVDPGNLPVLEAHLECAAAEAPLAETGEPFEPEATAKAVRSLERKGLLVRSADGSRWFPVRIRPHRLVDIRSVGRSFSILEEGTRTVIGSVSGGRAFSECHEGAVYLHRGRQYAIRRLDLEKGNVWASLLEADYYTRTLGEKETEVLETLRRRPVGNFVLNLGRVKVTERITGFQKRHTFTQETISQHDLDLPPGIFETVGLWLEIPEGTMDRVVSEGLHFMGGLHALEHAMIAVFPLFALCDREDVGGISTTFHPQVGGPAVFLYDGHPGGVGLCEKGFERMEALLEKTREVVAACPCETGCPSCIHSPKCGSGNVPLDKAACARILDVLLHGPPPAPREAAPPPAAEAPAPPLPGRDDPETLLRHRRVLVLDIETQRSAEEVGGWGNTHLMRVAVAVTWNSAEAAMSAWGEADMPGLLGALAGAELVVGFNLDSFDLGVLRGYARPEALRAIRTFDILADLHRRLGFRVSLGALAEETLGKGKSADGLQSLAWWKAGEIEKVRAYCEQDVAVTRDLFLFGLRNGYLLYKRKGERVRVPVDWELAKILP